MNFVLLYFGSDECQQSLALTGDEGGGFHLFGSSSTGKSTAQLVAASIWGSADYVRRWRATSNGLEGLAAAHNDLLLVLDELSELDPKFAGEVAYMLANGQGKQRAAKSGMGKKPLRWRTLFLSSGEITLADHIKRSGDKANAGQAIRCIDVPADAGCGFGLFDTLHQFESAQLFANHLKSATAMNYGVIGVEWLNYLASNREGAAERIRKLQNQFKQTQRPANAESQVLRALERFALCAAVGELATEQGFTGWKKGACFDALAKSFASWVDTRGGDGNLEEANLLAQVRSFITNYGESRFTDMDYPDKKDTINRVGFVKRPDVHPEFCKDDEKGQLEAGAIYYILPEGFKQIVEGFDPKWAKTVLVKHGWLELGANGEAQRKTFPKVGRQRCYPLSSKCLSD